MLRDIKDTINVRVRNNTAFTQNVNLLGGTSDPLGVPPSLLYQWDLSAETYFGSVTATIVISNTSNPIPVTYTVQVNGYNIQSVAFALNTLNLGVFQVSGNIIYVSNDYYIYGALSVVSTLFNSVWNTNNISSGSSAFNQIHLPLTVTGTYNFTVDWGDGSQDTITSWNQAEVIHTYTTAGTYNLSITGIINGFNFSTQDEEKILSITNFGTLQLGNNGGYFQGCVNLDLSSVTDILDLTGTTNLTNMFSSCNSLTTIGNVNSWDVSSVTNMTGMFLSANNFNQSLNSWDVGSVINMNSMFSGATLFNGNITAWNTSSVTIMISMFNQASAFNQPIDNWNVSSVLSMAGMFGSAISFNQSLNSWNTGNVTDMSSMFSSASSFNGNIGNWNTSSVINMSVMFVFATNFNQSLNSWNTGNVTDMSFMFLLANNFNGNITSWNTSSVTTMRAMFSTNSGQFNQNISGWDVSSVSNFGDMFVGAISFNQPIGIWNTSSGINMRNMFRSATAFNQDISAWNISSVTDFVGFMSLKSFTNYSASNLDAIYNSWSLITVQPNITIDFGTIKYTVAGQAGKNILDNAPNNWTITDGGI